RRTAERAVSLAAGHHLDPRFPPEPTDEAASSFDFVVDRFEFRRRELRRRALAVRWHEIRRCRASLDDQGAWGNQGCDFSIAEFVEQPKDNPVDGFSPDVLSRIKIAADSRRVDPWIDRGRIHGQQPSFAIADDANGLLFR